MVDIVQLSSSQKSRKIRDFKPIPFASVSKRPKNEHVDELKQKRRVQMSQIRKLKLQIRAKEQELSELQKQLQQLRNANAAGDF